MKTKTKALRTKKLKTLPENAILIGKGKLTWRPDERRSDRYGTVHLLENGDSTTRHHKFAEMVIPKGRGRLLAQVISPIESTHIGDLFRGLYPRTPKFGQIILLGEGRVFSVTSDGIESVGVMPDDGRAKDWLNPRALYDCHGSAVNLIFSASK